MNRVSESPPPPSQQSPEPYARSKNATVNEEDVRQFREMRGKNRKRGDKPSDQNEQEHIPLHRKKGPHDTPDQNEQGHIPLHRKKGPHDTPDQNEQGHIPLHRKKGPHDTPDQNEQGHVPLHRKKGPHDTPDQNEQGHVPLHQKKGSHDTPDQNEQGHVPLHRKKGPHDTPGQNEQGHVPLHRKKDPHDTPDQNDQQLLGDRILQNFHGGEETVSGKVVHEQSPPTESEAMEQIARMCRQLLVSQSSETQPPMRFVLKESLLPGTSLIAESIDGGGMRLRFVSKSSESLALLRRHREGIAARARRGASRGMSVEVEVIEEDAQYS